MWKLRSYDKKAESSFLEQGKGKLISRLLSQRNIPVDKADTFLSSDYAFLPHPHTLTGVDKAAELFCKIALAKGSVAIFGDYDCDGIIGSTMLKELCDVFGLKSKVFLPLRSEHGYGLNEKSLTAFKEQVKSPTDLLIVLDCGSNNEEEVKDLKEFGFKKIIILDHHIIDESKMSKSSDVLINWHLCNYEETCACGEIFQFIRGIRWLTKKVNPVEFLTYAAIGIIGDVSPLNIPNRIIVKNGLTSYARNNIVASGLQALINESWILGETLSQEDVSFKIVPKINATGRMLNPMLSFDLLTEKDQVMAELKAKEIQDYNDQRKKIQKEIEKEALSIVRGNLGKYKYGISIYKSHWNIGIVGIAASRISEIFCRPCILFGENDGDVKGSARSLKGINIKEILDSCSDMLIGHGGHELAAGATMDPKYVDLFNDAFNEACHKYYEENFYPKETKYYDAEIKTKFVSTSVAKLLLENFYPYCRKDNPEPVFKMENVTITNSHLKEGEGWKLLKFSVEKDSEIVPFTFMKFSPDFGAEVNSLVADIYFSFPQDIEKEELIVADIIFKN